MYFQRDVALIPSFEEGNGNTPMNKMLGNKKVVAIFALPTLLYFSLIVVYPIIQTFIKSFTAWDGISEAQGIGLANYIKLFDDRLFWKSFNNGLIFAAFLFVLQIGLATLFALLLLDNKIPFKRFFRTSIFIPVVLSVTVVCQLWSAIYNPEFGLINKLFETLGTDFRQSWLSDIHVSLYAIIAVNIWQRVGYQFAIIYAGAKSVPEELLEAATIDGASKFQTNLHVVIPLLKNTYRMCVVMAITGGFNAFAHMNLLTKGGPGTATYTLTMMTYRSAYSLGKYGYACTSAVILVAQCILATILIQFLFREREQL